MTLDEAVRSNLLDISTGLITDPSSGQQMTVIEAVKAGVIDADASSIVNPSTGQTVSLTEGLRLCIVDGKSGKVVDRTTGRTFGLDEAVKSAASIASAAGADAIVSKPKMTLDEALRSDLLDTTTGLVTDPSSGQQMTVMEAVKAGIIDAEASSIVNPSTGQTIRLTEGLRLGIVDGTTGKVVDQTTGKTFGLDESVSSGSNTPINTRVVVQERRPLNLKSAIEADVFDAATGAVRDPDTGVIKSLADAIRDGLIDPLDTILLDPVTGTACTLQDAVDRGIILPDTGMVYDKTSGKLMTFADAMKSGILVLEDKSSRDRHLISLEDAISSGLFDSRTGTFLDSSTNERVPFREALGKIVDVSGIEVRHPETNELLSLEQAVSAGLVNADTGYFDAATGSPVSLQQAVMLGYVMGWMARELTIDSVPASANKSSEAVTPNGLLDADAGLVHDSAAGKNISIDDAVKRGITDRKTPSTYDGTEESICRGLLDSRTGRVLDASSGQEQGSADVVAVSQVVDGEAVMQRRVSDESSAVSVAEAEARKSSSDGSEAVTGLMAAGRDADAGEFCVSGSEVQRSGLTQGISEWRSASLDTAAATADPSRRTVTGEPLQHEVKPPAAGHCRDLCCCFPRDVAPLSNS